MQAVPPVAGQYVEQIPVKTTHATRGPNSAWQSVSLLQVRQSCAAPRVKSAQNPAFPVVNVQWVLVLLALQVLSLPVVQIFRTGVQILVLWATHWLRSGFPLRGATPSQIPEQQLLLSPRHAWPTSTQP